MAVTREELLDFNRFAEEKLSDGGAENLQALLDEWNDQRAHEQSIAGIRESVAQYEAGEGLPVEEAFNEIRRKLGRAE
jgi:hypothetical protein